jgi:hypothetical protein
MISGTFLRPIYEMQNANKENSYFQKLQSEIEKNKKKIEKKSKELQEKIAKGGK